MGTTNDPIHNNQYSLSSTHSNEAIRQLMRRQSMVLQQYLKESQYKIVKTLANPNQYIIMVQHNPTSKNNKNNSSRLYYLKQLNYGDRNMYEKQLIRYNQIRFNLLQQYSQQQTVQVRDIVDIGSHSCILQLIKILGQEHKNYCTSFYKISLLFQYYDITVEKEIEARVRYCRPFTVNQLWAILDVCVTAMLELGGQECKQEGRQEGKQGQNLLLMHPNCIHVCDDGSLKCSHPSMLSQIQSLLSLAPSCIYYSPERLTALNQTIPQSTNQQMDGKINIKQCIYTLGLTILSAALLKPIHKQIYTFISPTHLILNEEQVQKLMQQMFIKFWNQQQQGQILVEMVANMLQTKPNRRTSLMELKAILDDYWCSFYEEKGNRRTSADNNEQGDKHRQYHSATLPNNLLTPEMHTNTSPIKSQQLSKNMERQHKQIRKKKIKLINLQGNKKIQRKPSINAVIYNQINQLLDEKDSNITNIKIASNSQNNRPNSQPHLQKQQPNFKDKIVVNSKNPHITPKLKNQTSPIKKLQQQSSNARAHKQIGKLKTATTNNHNNISTVINRTDSIDAQNGYDDDSTISPYKQLMQLLLSHDDSKKEECGKNSHPVFVKNSKNIMNRDGSIRNLGNNVIEEEKVEGFCKQQCQNKYSVSRYEIPMTDKYDNPPLLKYSATPMMKFQGFSFDKYDIPQISKYHPKYDTSPPISKYDTPPPLSKYDTPPPLSKYEPHSSKHYTYPSKYDNPLSYTNDFNPKYEMIRRNDTIPKYETTKIDPTFNTYLNKSPIKNPFMTKNNSKAMSFKQKITHINQLSRSAKKLSHNSPSIQNITHNPIQPNINVLPTFQFTPINNKPTQIQNNSNSNNNNIYTKPQLLKNISSNNLFPPAWLDMRKITQQQDDIHNFDDSCSSEIRMKNTIKHSNKTFTAVKNNHSNTAQHQIQQVQFLPIQSLKTLQQQYHQQFPQYSNTLDHTFCITEKSDYQITQNNKVLQTIFIPIRYNYGKQKIVTILNGLPQTTLCQYQGQYSNNMKNGKGTIRYYQQQPTSTNQFTKYNYNYQDFTVALTNIKTQSLKDYKNIWITGYEGNFKDNHKNGYGVLYLCNGQRYQGDFVDDCVHGRGTYHSKLSIGKIMTKWKCIDGRWVNNKLVEVVRSYHVEKNDG